MPSSQESIFATTGPRTVASTRNTRTTLSTVAPTAPTPTNCPNRVVDHNARTRIRTASDRELLIVVFGLERTGHCRRLGFPSSGRRVKTTIKLHMDEPIDGAKQERTGRTGIIR